VYQKPQKYDDLNPDGIKVVVAWKYMVVGASVFIPCINTTRAGEQVRKIAELKSWRVAVRTRIENKMFGVRIWRTV
jgi:hypothetical protein